MTFRSSKQSSHQSRSSQFGLRIQCIGSALQQLLVLTLVVALVGGIGPTAPLFAQAAAVSQSGASTPIALHITILDGEDALNSIRERTAREPIVQVEDENHKPVAGALILFSVQNGSTGAGGTFADGLQTLRVTTGADGRGVAHGLQPNQTQGSYAIGVTATLGALVVTAQIHQQNVAGGGGGAPGAPGSAIAETPATGAGSIGTKVGRFGHIPKKVWVTGGVIVTVGVVVGVVVATRGNNPTTITAGSGTVTPP